MKIRNLFGMLAAKFAALVVVCAMTGQAGADVMHTVTFKNSLSDAIISSQEVADGQAVAQPADPSYVGYVFAAWSADKANVYDFATPVTADTTIYAMFVKAGASLTQNGTTTYYYQFINAWSALNNLDANNGVATLKLLANYAYTGSAADFTFRKPVILDLNGYVVENRSQRSYPFRSTANLTIQDTSAGGNGKLYASHATTAALLVGDSSGTACTFTMKSGCIQSETAILDTYDNVTLNIEGGSMVSYSQYGAGDSRSLVYELSSGCTLNVTGGEFRSDQSAKSWDTMSFDPFGYPTKRINANSTISVTGGTFSGQAIQTYIPGYTASQEFSNADSVITVGDYTVTRSTVSSPYGAAPYDVYVYTVALTTPPVYVAQIVSNNGATTNKYANLMEAIDVAYNGGTVELLTDVTVNHWHQNVWSVEDSDQVVYGGNRAVTGCNGLTINGNGHSLTINGIDSGKNGNQLFYGSRNLTVLNLTINAASGVNGIGLKSGTISDVTFNMAGSNPAIYTSGSAGCEAGEHIEIRNCTFNTSAADSYGIYSCDPENGVDSGTIISGNTFNTRRSVALRSDMQFLNNTVNGQKGVTVAGGSTAVVRGNYFADTTTSRSINVYPSNATIENNVILGPIELENETYAVAPDLSKNYWANGNAPANLPEGVVCNTYYDTCTMYDSPAQDGSLFELSGIHPDIEISDPEAQDGATETSATYNVNVTVDGQSAGTQSVTVSVAADDIAHTTLSSVKLDSVLTAVIAAQGTDASAVTEVEILVSAVDTNTVNETIVYDVKPEAIVTVTKGNVSTQSEPIELSNDDLAPGASFTIQLDVTPLGAKAGDSVKVAHESDDPAYATETYFVQAFAGDNDKVYVRVTVSHFSTFTLSLLSSQPVTTSVQSANLFGAVKISGNVAANMYVAVPFEGFESAGAARKAKDVVHPANLTEETKMYVYNKTSKSHDVYKVAASGAWAPAVKVTIDSNNDATLDEASLDREVGAGSGVLVERKSTSDAVYVYGQIPSAGTNSKTFGPGRELVAPPYTNATVKVGGVKYVDLNAATWTDVKATTSNRVLQNGADYVQFRDESNNLRQYFFEKGSWGVPPRQVAAYGVLVKDGKALVPQGTAFWYCSSAGGAKVEWK